MCLKLLIDLNHAVYPDFNLTLRIGIHCWLQNFAILNAGDYYKFLN